MKYYNKNTAELVGIVLGDGSIYSKNGCYSLGIFGHSTDDRKYLLNYVSRLLEKTIGFKPSVFYYKTHQEMRLQVCRKKAVYFMAKLGVKSGNKKLNNQGIPKWIFRNKEYMKSCVRGLIDTDGCVFSKYRYPNVPQIEFYSSIPKLRKDFYRIMKKLGFKTGKWRSKKYGSPVIGIYSKSEAFKYNKQISFNNEKNIRKFSVTIAPIV